MLAFNVDDGSTGWGSDESIADAPVGPHSAGRWLVTRGQARTPTLFVFQR